MNTPVVEKKDKMVIGGINYYGNPFENHEGWNVENEIGKLWNRFMYLFYQKREKISSIADEKAFYEIHIRTDKECDGNQEYGIMVGVELKEISELPEEMVLKVFGEREYLVFSLNGREIVENWKTMNDWIENSEYIIDGNYMIQMYDSRFKGMDRIDESVMEAWFPIKGRI